MPKITDTFTGADGALGPADTGQQPVVLRGAATRKSGRGFAANTTDRLASTIVAYDAGIGGQDGVLELDLGTTGGGYALMFRVVDVGNWWRLSVRQVDVTTQTGTEQVQVGTETYQSGTQQVVVGYTQTQTGTEQYVIGQESYITGYTAVEYQWRQNYAGATAFHMFPEIHHLLDWNTSTTTAPSFPTTLAHYHYHDGSNTNDVIQHFHSKSGTPYRTGVTRGGSPIYGTRDVYGTRPTYTSTPVYETQPVYSTRPVYETRPTYTTTSGYEMHLNFMQAGTQYGVAGGHKVLPSRPAKLRVEMDGNSHTCTARTAGGAQLGDAFGPWGYSQHATARRHGWGYDAETKYGNADGVDNLTFTPSSSGNPMRMVV